MTKRMKKDQSFLFFIMLLASAVSFIMFNSNNVYAFSETGTSRNNGNGTVYKSSQVKVNCGAELEKTTGKENSVVNKNATPDPMLDIEFQYSMVNVGDTFQVIISLKNAANTMVTDFAVNYDSNLLMYVSAENMDSNSYILDSANASEKGKIKIFGENTDDKTLTGDNQIIKLTFKANTIIGKGNISISDVYVWNLDSHCYHESCSDQTFSVINCDVNRDGKVDIRDYIAFKNCEYKTSDKWGNCKPDVNGDGKVDNQDKSCLFEYIFKRKK